MHNFKSQKTLRVLISLLLAALLVTGIVFFYLSEQNNSEEQNIEPTTQTPTVTSTPTPTIAEELVEDYQLKTYSQDYEYRTSSQEDKAGEFIFEYPDIFELTVIEDLTGDIRMCDDFVIKDELFEMTINTNCEPWSAEYYSLPTEYEIIFKRESVGTGTGDFYLIRRKELNGKYLYSSALIEPGTELTSSKMAYDGYSISVNGEDGHFGLLFFIDVTIDSENQQNITKYLEIADNIVKSLRSNRI